VADNPLSAEFAPSLTVRTGTTERILSPGPAYLVGRALVWRLLTSGGYVYVYVCGSQPMREAVRAAFVDVIAHQGALPRERAEAYLADLETTARYRPDLWG
jgi:NAD(P)H-flavin reductase